MVKALRLPQPVQRHLGRPAPPPAGRPPDVRPPAVPAIPDLDRTSYFLVFGANPMASNGSLMTVPDFPQRLRALRARGGRMVVFDPRRTETAKVADEHHFVRPGTDAFVLLAMLQVVLEEGLGTPPPAYVDGLAAVEAAVAPYTPELAEEHSGVPADEVRRVARDLAGADRAAAYGRIGVSAHAFGSVCVWAINCLNILTGNLDRVGGAMFTDPAIDAVGTGLIGRGHFDLWRSRVRGLPEASGELPVSALREEIETPGDGQIRALLTVAGNPVLSTPDGAALRPRPDRPGLHGGGGHLRQRDHPARRRHPAADDRARARPLRPGVPPPRGAQHRPVHPGRVREGRRPAPRLGDLPRGGAAHHRPAREARRAPGGAAQPADVSGAADRLPHAAGRPTAPPRPLGGDAEGAARPSRGRGPRTAPTGCAPSTAPDQERPARPGTGAGARRPGPAGRRSPAGPGSWS